MHKHIGYALLLTPQDTLQKQISNISIHPFSLQNNKNTNSHTQYIKRNTMSAHVSPEDPMQVTPSSSRVKSTNSTSYPPVYSTRRPPASLAMESSSTYPPSWPNWTDSNIRALMPKIASNSPIGPTSYSTFTSKSTGSANIDWDGIKSAPPKRVSDRRTLPRLVGTGYASVISRTLISSKCVFGN